MSKAMVATAINGNKFLFNLLIKSSLKEDKQNKQIIAVFDEEISKDELHFIPASINKTTTSVRLHKFTRQDVIDTINRSSHQIKAAINEMLETYSDLPKEYQSVSCFNYQEFRRIFEYIRQYESIQAVA